MPETIHTLISPPSALVADSNGDGRLTLADGPTWLAHLFFLPGDWSLWVIAKYAPPIASLLGGNAPAYGGFISGFIAVAFWFLALLVLGAGYSYAVAFDRRATRAFSQIYGEIRRALRVAWRLLRARIRRREVREERNRH